MALKETLVLALVVVAATSARARADKPAPQPDLITSELGELRVAANCGDQASPWRPWCIAAAWATGAAADLPKGKILVGLTVALEQGKNAADALREQVTFVAFAVGKDGKVKLTDVKPTNADEEKAVAEAVFGAAAVFKGKATTAKLPASLSDYIKTLTGTYATTRTGNAWVWQGASASQMRKVGKFWVVIEVPDAKNGVFATILTDAWK